MSEAASDISKNSSRSDPSKHPAAHDFTGAYSGKAERRFLSEPALLAGHSTTAQQQAKQLVATFSRCLLPCDDCQLLNGVHKVCLCEKSDEGSSAK